MLFNRFLQPDIDTETLAVAPGVLLSRAAEARLPMTWITLLHGRIDASLAATTGVEGSTELIKYLLAGGADVVMTASALLRHGPDYAAVLLDGLRDWMARKGYASIDEVRGLLAFRSEPMRPHTNAATTSARCGGPTAPSTGRGDVIRFIRGAGPSSMSIRTRPA